MQQQDVRLKFQAEDNSIRVLTKGANLKSGDIVLMVERESSLAGLDRGHKDRLRRKQGFDLLSGCALKVARTPT